MQRLRELLRVFLTLGFTSFGGPAAHIALMEDELVRRRAWLAREEFLDLVAASNLLPGPTSTELAIHVGWKRAGWAGLIVAGVAFILPAAVIVAALAFLYVRFGRLPQIAGVLWGVKPVVLVVVAQALVSLGRTALKRRSLVAIAVGAAVAAVAGWNELLVLGAAGAVALGLAAGGRAPVVRAPALLPALALAPLSVTAASSTKVFLVFLKIGSVLFGSGYVLLAFLRAELCERLGWISEAQLLDAVAVGQVTPGPLFSTATFIGWIIGGPGAAAAATLGIFLPAFLFVAVSGPLVPRLRRSRLAGAFLDGVAVASLALMAVVLLSLARGAIVDVPSAGLVLAAAGLLFGLRVPSMWLALGGALFGLGAALLRG